MPVGIFLLFYLWQFIPVRNLPREDGICSTETVAGGRDLCKLPYKACCSGKCVSRAFWYLFLNHLPLILITNPLVYFLQVQFFPGISFFSLWRISTVNGCGHVTKPGQAASVTNKSCEWFHTLLLCIVLVWADVPCLQPRPKVPYVCSAFSTQNSLFIKGLPTFLNTWLPGVQKSSQLFFSHIFMMLHGVSAINAWPLGILTGCMPS